MTERIVRIRIPDEVYKKFKIMCVENDLSITKQTAQIIIGFINIQEENKKMMMHLKKGN